MAMPIVHEFEPDHIIIWFDKNVYVGGNNSARAILSMLADVNHPESDEYNQAIRNFLGSINPYLNETRFDALVRSPLRICIDEDECIKCINDNIKANKRVFLITSGQTGASVIPRLSTIPELYVKLAGSIYVFCAQRSLHEQWTGRYENDIVIYDDDRGVFGRVLSDIAVYYLRKAQDGTENPRAAVQYLYWAGRLFQTAARIDSISRNDFLICVQMELPNPVEPPPDAFDDDIQLGVPPQENPMIP